MRGRSLRTSWWPRCPLLVPCLLIDRPGPKLEGSGATTLTLRIPGSDVGVSRRVVLFRRLGRAEAARASSRTRSTVRKACWDDEASMVMTGAVGGRHQILVPGHQLGESADRRPAGTSGRGRHHWQIGRRHPVASATAGAGPGDLIGHVDELHQAGAPFVQRCRRRRGCGVFGVSRHHSPASGPKAAAASAGSMPNRVAMIGPRGVRPHGLEESGRTRCWPVADTVVRAKVDHRCRELSWVAAREVCSGSTAGSITVLARSEDPGNLPTARMSAAGSNHADSATMTQATDGDEEVALQMSVDTPEFIGLTCQVSLMVTLRRRSRHTYEIALRPGASSAASPSSM